MTQPALWQIGQAANGSMRDALSLTDQAIAFGDGGISESGVTAMLGLVNQAQILDLLECIASKNAAEVLSRIEALADYQPDFVAICGSLLDTLHRVAIEQQVPGALADQLGDLARILNIAKTVSPEEIQVMYQSLLVGRRDLHLAHSARAGFEMLMLRLIAFRPAPPMTMTQQAPIAAEVEKKTPEVDSASSSENTLTSAALTEHVEAEPDAPEAISTNGAVESEPQAQPVQASSSTNLSADERPPWEDVPTHETMDETVEDKIAAVSQSPEAPETQSADTRLEPILASEDPEVVSSDDSDAEVETSNVMTHENEVSVDHQTPQQDINASSVELDSSQNDSKMSERAAARVESLLEASHKESESVDEDEEEDEEEAEERAIADVADPFNPAADLVEALASDVVEAEPELAEKDSSDPRLAKVPDTIAQPALGMPLPELNHYNELTMQIWWLVAPRLPLRGLVQNILMNSSMVDASDQGIRLQVPLEYGHMLNQVRYEQIQGALSDFFAMPVPLIIDTVEETEGVTAEEFAASKRAEALQVAIQHLNSHPVVQALSSTMGAQLVYDSVKVKA